VDSGFAPYATNGYWIYTDNGWTWVSNYPWGWAPFHYGRWYTDPTYGPVWVPDNVWGPGWVTWRRSNNYYGWAPLRPGIGIRESNRHGYKEDNDRWRFVKGSGMGRKDLRNYYVNPSKNASIVTHSTVINKTRVDKKRNVTYNEGPDRADVEKHTGRAITPIAVKDNRKPGQSVGKTQLKIYKPRMQGNAATGPKPAPAKVAGWNDVKKVAEKPHEAPPARNPKPARQKTTAPPPAKAVQQNPIEGQPKRNTAGQQPPPQQPKSHPRQNTEGEGQPPRQRTQPTRQQPTPQPEKQQPAQQPQSHPRQNTEGEGQPPRQRTQPIHQQPGRTQPQSPPRQNTEGEGQPPRQQPQKDPHQDPAGEKHF
jgi:hypothetical protein